MQIEIKVLSISSLLEIRRKKACNHPILVFLKGYRQVALLPTSVVMIHAMREPLCILSSYRMIWRYSEKGEQELKAHLS